jgi:hypothetical protein
MATAAIATGTTAARRRSRAHAAAGNAFIAAAFESKHRHHALYFDSSTFTATHRFITSKDKFFEMRLALITLVFIDGHVSFTSRID